MNNPRVYLSGPMTGIAEFNFPAFHSAAADLRACGFDVVNPAEINVDVGLSWEQCLRADIKALCDCDSIVLLPGWETSKGAHLELHVAHRLGLTVSHYKAISLNSQRWGADEPKAEEDEMDTLKAGVAWELALLAQTLEFSDSVRMTCQQGADKIERLRVALTELVAFADAAGLSAFPATPGYRWTDAWKAARDALTPNV